MIEHLIIGLGNGLYRGIGGAAIWKRYLGWIKTEGYILSAAASLWLVCTGHYGEGSHVITALLGWCAWYFLMTQGFSLNYAYWTQWTPQERYKRTTGRAGGSWDRIPQFWIDRGVKPAGNTVGWPLWLLSVGTQCGLGFFALGWGLTQDLWWGAIYALFGMNLPAFYIAVKRSGLLGEWSTMTDESGRREEEGETPWGALTWGLALAVLIEVSLRLPLS